MKWQDIVALYESYFNTYPILKTYNLTINKRLKRSLARVIHSEKLLELSTFIISSSQLNETLLHEIAHIIDRDRNGIQPAHGKTWKIICSELGISPEHIKSTCSEHKIVMEHQKFYHRFKLVCPSCNETLFTTKNLINGKYKIKPCSCGSNYNVFKRFNDNYQLVNVKYSPTNLIG